MDGNAMKVEVVKAYGPWSVGQIFEDMQPNQARMLIARGLVREVKEKSVTRSPLNRMLRSTVAKAV
jgi:hypothetical protein